MNWVFLIVECSVIYSILTTLVLWRVISQQTLVMWHVISQPTFVMWRVISQQTLVMWRVISLHTISVFFHQEIWVFHWHICNRYRITAVLKVKKGHYHWHLAPASTIGRAVIMSVATFKTDVIVFIGDVIMCLTSDWRVTNWPNIFVDQGQFIDPDFISGTHQMENVQFADNTIYLTWIWRLTNFVLKVNYRLVFG